MVRSVVLLLGFALIVSTLAGPFQPKEEGAGGSVQSGLKEPSPAVLADVTRLRRFARQVNNIGNGGNSKGYGNAGNGGNFTNLTISGK